MVPDVSALSLSQEQGKKVEEFARRNFSQFGEDAVLLWLFAGSRDGFYVDVGCHHPLRISNTALLHIDYGWRGINIDVDQRAIDAFNVYRPSDINICMGVAKEKGSLEVTFFDEGAINTFSEESASRPEWQNMPRRKSLVPVVSLAAILEEHLPPGETIDLLDLDAEGLDLEILESNDWGRFRPLVVCVELEQFAIDTIRQHPVYMFMQSNGYRLISYVAQTAFFRR